MKAWLHRRERATWEFEWSDIHMAYVHTTSKGTLYAIRAGLNYGKPFWIARRCLGDDGRWCWVTWERELRAKSIEFENAGEYIFPGEWQSHHGSKK